MANLHSLNSLTSLKIEICRHVKSRRQPENIFRWSRRDIIWTRASNTHAQLLQSTHSAFHEQTTSKDRKSTRKGKKQTSGQKKTKIYKKKLSTHDVYDVFVVFFNFSFLALPGDFWVAPKGVFSNSRQSLPVSGTGIADSNRSRDYGFLELSQFPKPWIPEIYAEKFPGFRIRKTSRNPQSVLPYIGQSMLLRGLIGFLLVFKLFFSIRIK